jgi:choline dehydrogenase
MYLSTSRVTSGGSFPGHDWGYVSEPGELGQSISLPRARFIGGCSSTNGCFALRGARADYDAWALLGNAGWSFDDALPFFRRLETDADFPADELNSIQLAFMAAAESAGLAYVDDHNRPRRPWARADAATCVRLTDGEILAADRVVLAAGTYASPAILLRPGGATRLASTSRTSAPRMT